MELSDKMKIAVLSNVNMDLVIASLKKKCDVFQSEGYGQWITYALTVDEKLNEYRPNVIFLILDSKALTESHSQYMKYIEKMSENYPYSLIAVSDVDDENVLVEAGWKKELDQLCEKDNIVSFPLSSIIKKNGRDNFYSNQMWYTGSIPYNMKAMGILADEMYIFACRTQRVRKKVLVVDLDNTLWGGAVGEEGPEGITLGESNIGAAYRDAQFEIKKIKDSGILLAISSKNNIEDVDAAFDNNRFMVLKKDDFVTSRIDWNLKSENIKSMAKELNLGIDSFVFLDDNPIEREEVRVGAPGVTVVDFPQNVANLADVIKDINSEYFWSPNQTEEDKNKSEQYKQEKMRKSCLESAASLDDYIRSLDIKIVMNEVRPEQYNRVVQLINKTNQFNTNTLRFDNQSFLDYCAKDNHNVWVANVSDKFGNSGLVAVVMGHEEANEFIIDNFLMSCRVMGRKIECAIISAIHNEVDKDMSASYVRTEKNSPVEKLWETLGFSLIESNDNEKRYLIKRDESISSILEVSWI